MTDLVKAGKISASGMRAQGTRMRVISENLANADSTPIAPGADPYRRKVATFRTQLDRQEGVEKVKLKEIQYDGSEFQLRYNPSHPAADTDGYVRMPNVNPLIEMMDMREAQRSYEANLNMLTMSRDMLTKTLSIIDQQ